MTTESSYEDAELSEIWRKASAVEGYDPSKYRKDAAGAWIKYSEYGNRGSKTNFGWEVDHIVPKSKGGSDNMSNLRPLQWANNAAKGDDYPHWTPAVTSEGTHNTER